MVPEKTFMYKFSLDIYEDEGFAYPRLKKMQGEDVPRLLTRVPLPSTVDPAPSFFELEGLLLELLFLVATYDHRGRKRYREKDRGRFFGTKLFEFCGPQTS